MSETTAIKTWRDRVDAAAASLPGADRPWLRDLRRQGAESFAGRGFPTPRVESWKYTNLRSVASADPATFAPAETAVPAAVGAHRLVFVGGRFDAARSSIGHLPDGVTLAPLSELIARDANWLRAELTPGGETQPLVALNAALLSDGYALRVAKGVALGAVEIVFVGGGIAAPCNLVVLDAQAEATVIERWLGADGAPYFVNAVTDVRLGAGARLRRYKAQGEGDAAFHLARTRAALARDARFESFVLQTGAKLARDEIDVRMGEPGASCELLGAYLGRGSQHLDQTTFIDHAAPHCQSREIYKGVLDDAARGVFQGKILVREGAQKTDGHQLSRVLLLSPDAEADAKPELEIYADDVKCSHGSTTGDLDEDQLFYLRARGVPAAEARAMLTQAFLQDVVDEIADEAVRGLFAAIVAARLAKGSEQA